jgi:hypothetical protein
VNRPRLRRIVFALGLASAGCGPVEYLSQVGRRAPAALIEAQRHGAEQLAPYEYAAAEEYLHEARVQGSRSSYQRAVEYGRKAEELAVRAEGLARQKASQSDAASPAPRP